MHAATGEGQSRQSACAIPQLYDDARAARQPGRQLPHGHGRHRVTLGRPAARERGHLPLCSARRADFQRGAEPACAPGYYAGHHPGCMSGPVRHKVHMICNTLPLERQKIGHGPK